MKLSRPGYPSEWEKQQLYNEQREKLQRYKNMLQRVYEDPETPLRLKCVIEDFWAIENRKD
jgi:hypothetical protein